MASQAEILVAGGDPHASVLVVLESVPDFALALSSLCSFSALSPFSLIHPLSFPASPPAPAPAGHGCPGHL
ncbi:hypothetical protein [Streptomyces sp. IMTB 2501]|uniref:hypothetical protein n=1 Tax=Streptomyces sp. IMTB 2501 TaxID=1776340 RepID=UPI0015BDC970|nr:hypothetical protein [Streptomyces sp. IMTB 2501]